MRFRFLMYTISFVSTNREYNSIFSTHPSSSDIFSPLFLFFFFSFILYHPSNATHFHTHSNATNIVSLVRKSAHDKWFIVWFFFVAPLLSMMLILRPRMRVLIFSCFSKHIVRLTNMEIYLTSRSAAGALRIARTTQDSTDSPKAVFLSLLNRSSCARSWALWTVQCMDCTSNQTTHRCNGKFPRKKHTLTECYYIQIRKR